MKHTGYQVIQDLEGEIEVPRDGILSHPLVADDSGRVVLFAFSGGQELSEHTASVPAILHVLEGSATVQLGKDQVEAGPGTWIHMEAGLPHRVVANSDVLMLLTLLKAGGGS